MGERKTVPVKGVSLYGPWRHLAWAAVAALGACAPNAKARTNDAALTTTEERNVCKTAGIPAGFVVVQHVDPWSPCGELGAYRVRRTGESRMTICDSQALPRGYAITQRIGSSICGTWRSGPNSFSNKGAWVIEALGAREFTICEDQPVPASYVVVRKVVSSVCGSWRSGENSWTNWGALVIQKL